MGDGWGARAGGAGGARAGARWRGGTGRARALGRAGGAGRGARARWSMRASARGQVRGAHAGGAGRGWRARGNVPTLPTVRVPPPHHRRQPPSTSDHHPDAPSICPCAAHSAWGVGVAEDIGGSPVPSPCRLVTPLYSTF